MTAGPTANGHSLENGAPTPLGAQLAPETKGLDDAVYAAGEMLKARGRDRRKIIFLISDGNNSRRNEHTFDQTFSCLLNRDSPSIRFPWATRLLQHETRAPGEICREHRRRLFFCRKRRGSRAPLLQCHRAGAQPIHSHVSLPKMPTAPRIITRIEVRVRRPELDVPRAKAITTSAVNGPN